MLLAKSFSPLTLVRLPLAGAPNKKTGAITVILENVEIFVQKGWAMIRNMPGLRLGGYERLFAARLVNGTPICVMNGPRIVIDNDGYEVEHDGEGVYRRIAKASGDQLSCQQQEMIGLDPEVFVPVRALPKPGKPHCRVDVDGPLPNKRLFKLGRTLAVGCRLSEVPGETSVKVYHFRDRTTRLIIRPRLVPIYFGDLYESRRLE
jgi:hypothetical protein